MRTIPSILIATIVVLISSPSLALRSTDIEAYLDPAYTDYQPKRLLLVISGSSDFRKEVRKKVNKRIVKKYDVEVFEYNDLFVPTREWTAEQVSDVMLELMIDSVLEITSEGYDSQFERIQTGSTTNTYGTASVYGNNAYGNATSHTQNNYMTIARDSAQVSAKLTEWQSGNTVWIAGISTKGSGTLMVGAGWTASSVVSNLVKDWVSNGLLLQD